MPTRKQKRRREKEKRHDYEYVYVDSTGQEVEVELDDENDAAPAKTPRSGGVRPTAKPKASPAKGRGAMREIKPPSWQRVFRRGLIMAPLLLVFVYLTKPENATAASLVATVMLPLVVFLPLSYFMDDLMYRKYLKRIGQPDPRRATKS